MQLRHPATRPGSMLCARSRLTPLPHRPGLPPALLAPPSLPAPQVLPAGVPCGWAGLGTAGLSGESAVCRGCICSVCWGRGGEGRPCCKVGRRDGMRPCMHGCIVIIITIIMSAPRAWPRYERAAPGLRCGLEGLQVCPAAACQQAALGTQRSSAAQMHLECKVLVCPPLAACCAPSAASAFCMRLPHQHRRRGEAVGS